MIARYRLVVSLAVSLLVAACSANLNYLSIPVLEGGHRVQAKKFFSDAFGVNEAEVLGYRAALKGDYRLAVTYVKDEVQRRPNDAWAHYDLGILYEATGEWEKAMGEMHEGRRADASTKKGAADPVFEQEISFIEENRRRAALM